MLVREPLNLSCNGKQWWHADSNRVYLAITIFSHEGKHHFYKRVVTENTVKMYDEMNSLGSVEFYNGSGESADPCEIFVMQHYFE